MLAFSATNQQLQQQQHVEMPNVIAEHPLKELEEKQDILKFFGVSSDRDFPEGYVSLWGFVFVLFVSSFLFGLPVQLFASRSSIPVTHARTCCVDFQSNSKK